MNCAYCGEPLVGYGIPGRNGIVYCGEHYIPEQRGERGQFKDGVRVRQP